MENISVKAPAVDRSITVEYDFCETLEQAVEKFGAEAVFGGFKASARVDLQSFVRGKLTAKAEGSDEFTNTNEEIVAAVAEWTPGDKNRVTKSPMEKLKEMLSKLSPEEREAFLSNAL